MSSLARDLYLREVLGVLPTNLPPPTRVSSHAMTSRDQALVRVLIQPAAQQYQMLLEKILSSIGLKSSMLQVSELGVEASSSLHVLAFLGSERQGRREQDGEIWWHLHALSQMVGEGEGVTHAKRTTWELLKQYQAEVSAR